MTNYSKNNGRSEITPIEKANIGCDALSAALLYSRRKKKAEHMLGRPPHPEEAPATD